MTLSKLRSSHIASASSCPYADVENRLTIAFHHETQISITGMNIGLSYIDMSKHQSDESSAKRASIWRPLKSKRIEARIDTEVLGT